MAALDIDKQVEFMDRRMNIEDFQDPAKVKKFVTRFAVLHDVETGGAMNTVPLSGAASLLSMSPLGGPPPIITIDPATRSEEHTSELQSLMRNSYAVFCLKKKNNKKTKT